MVYSEGPDKGHAWVIAIAAGVITMILSGISKMVGILYVAVIETYGVSREEATLPFTFRKSLRSLAGPIVGIIGQRYGIRSVTLFGSIIAALGAALCFIAPTVGWMALCWGGIHGLGEAFANTLFQVVVNQYFVKHRSTASGIALSGACIGSVMFSFLIEALREAYGLQGTFLILSGVILHVFPAALLLKSPSWVTNPNAKAPPKSFKESIKDRPRMYVVPDDYVKSNAAKKMSTISLNPNMLEKNEILSVTNLPFKSHSTMNLVESLEKKLDGMNGCDNLAYNVEKENNQKKPLEKRLSIQNVFATSKESLYERVPSSYDLHEDSSLKKNVAESSKNGNQAKENNLQKEEKKSMLENAIAMAKLYKNPVFVLICVCMASYVLVFIPIMTSIVDYSKDKGLPETIGKYLIHAMALGDIVGRLCFGWVTDKEYMTIPHYMTLTLVLEGIFLISIPFTNSLYAYLSLLALYSMTSGSMLVRLPVMVLKNVKKEDQTVAMGCYGLASGVVPLALPALIGHFRDGTGSYDGMYFLLGGICMLSGAFWILEPYLVRLNERLEGKRNEAFGP